MSDGVACIWCGKADPNPSAEHIFPKALGCPEGLILTKGEVCTRCNNRLGKTVDLALVQNYEPFLEFGGYRSDRFGNRLSGFGDLRLTRTATEEPRLTVNMARKTITDHWGRVVGPRRSTSRVAKAEFSDLGDGQGGIKLELRLVHDDRYTRALHKIALELVAAFHGAHLARHPEFNAVRDYVLRGIGKRRVLLAPAPHECKPMMFAQPPAQTKSGEIIAMFVTINAINIVDLSPPQSYVPILERQLDAEYGNGWTWTPLGPDSQRVTQKAG